jgi:hypothetical protein
MSAVLWVVLGVAVTVIVIIVVAFVYFMKHPFIH